MNLYSIINNAIITLYIYRINTTVAWIEFVFSTEVLLYSSVEDKDENYGIHISIGET